MPNDHIKALERSLTKLLKDLEAAEHAATQAKTVYNARSQQAARIRTQCRQLERAIKYLKPDESEKEPYGNNY